MLKEHIEQIKRVIQQSSYPHRPWEGEMAHGFPNRKHRWRGTLQVDLVVCLTYAKDIKYHSEALWKFDLNFLLHNAGECRHIAH